MDSICRGGFVVAARFDPAGCRLCGELNTSVRLAIPVRLIEELCMALAEAVSDIRISQTGLDLHWPLLDADVYVPGLRRGVYGTERWMKSLLDAAPRL